MYYSMTVRVSSEGIWDRHRASHPLLPSLFLDISLSRVLRIGARHNVHFFRQRVFSFQRICSRAQETSRVNLYSERPSEQKGSSRERISFRWKKRSLVREMEQLATILQTFLLLYLRYHLPLDFAFK